MVYVNLNKACLNFPIYNAQSFSLKQSIVKAATGGMLKQNDNVTTVAALKDISFSLQSGDRLGLIGHNGSGKTTLLKLLAGIYQPTGGTLEIKGKVATIFDMLLGTHDEMTGYENLYLSSILRGKSPAEAKNSLEAMAKFTELENYLYIPMRTYSAGMKLRIGLAVATEGNPDILLIDEVFGTGDQHFVTKSTDRLLSLISRTGILVFSSHSEVLLRQVCNKVMILEHGEIKAFGETDKVLSFYNNANFPKNA